MRLLVRPSVYCGGSWRCPAWLQATKLIFRNDYINVCCGVSIGNSCNSSKYAANFALTKEGLRRWWSTNSFSYNTCTKRLATAVTNDTNNFRDLNTPKNWINCSLSNNQYIGKKLIRLRFSTFFLLTYLRFRKVGLFHIARLYLAIIVLKGPLKFEFQK